MIAAEHDFAAQAADKGNRTAFLAFMTDDAIAFSPERVSAKSYWSGRSESKALLSWAPNFADISLNGTLGYTTGNWEWRQTKGSDPSAFGEFITIWQKQEDGAFKWVLDIGIDHPKPETYSTVWKSRTEGSSGRDRASSSIEQITTAFSSTLTRHGLGRAYDKFAANDIRVYRQGRMPILGKSKAIILAKSEVGDLTIAGERTEYVSRDLAAFVCKYSRTDDKKEIEHGNVLQVWRVIAGKWRLVLDIFLPIPKK